MQSLDNWNNMYSIASVPWDTANIYAAGQELWGLRRCPIAAPGQPCQSLATISSIRTITAIAFNGVGNILFNIIWNYENGDAWIMRTTISDCINRVPVNVTLASASL